VSLRDLIAAKQRRTVTWPLLVGNPSAAAAEVTTFQRALDVHEALVAEVKRSGKRPTKAQIQRSGKLREDLQSAVKRMQDCVVSIELQSLPDDEWEALFGPIEPDEDGDIDISSIHAALLAASCTDPELQDVEWWTEQLNQPTWSKGDKATLSRTLLQLNGGAPQFDFLGKD
jgi:hypothetical protein